MKNTIQGLFLLLCISTVFSSCGYNQLVEKENDVESQWAQVENVYQRRADLVPTIKASMQRTVDIESQLIDKVEAAAKKAESVKIGSDDLSEKAVKQFDAAQDGLQEALNTLLAEVEKYPDLKSNQDFMEARAQLEGSENRIAVERRKYNMAVDEYNTYRNQIPQKFTARVSGFKDQPYFKSEK